MKIRELIARLTEIAAIHHDVEVQISNERDEVCVVDRVRFVDHGSSAVVTIETSDPDFRETPLFYNERTNTYSPRTLSEVERRTKFDQEDLANFLSDSMSDQDCFPPGA